VSAASFLVPPRARGAEWLDDNSLDPAIALRSLEDVRRTNRFFGGTAAVLAELRPLLRKSGGVHRDVSLLDVGTGAGDIPAAARHLAKAMGTTLRTIGVDFTHPIARAATPACGTGITGDARRLPFASRSVDIVTCSQVIHHFADNEVREVIAELHRVARRAVIIGDLRRTRIAAAGVWLASWPLRFHPVSRHDGVLSVMRGFTTDELATLVREATGCTAQTRRRAGFRVTASWSVA
jgi:2-polyprenyl-3-methyl-5-hydroxy-6-metoxy-1,4-benzoquinol methylase